MRIVGYDPKYKADFIALNLSWIEEMFKVEPTDEREFDNIEKYIDAGGQIFFALSDTGEVMACCMIAPREDGDWEIMKFAASDKFKGKGAGRACLEAALIYAREKGVNRLIIVSNKRCVQALHLYRSMGFSEMPVDRQKFPFDRADIAFEMFF